MSILPPINEVPLTAENAEDVTSPRTPGWCIALLISSSCSGIFYTVDHHRRLSGMARPRMRSIPKHSLLFDDGTLFAALGDEPLCDFFTQGRRLHTQVKRLQLHLPSCNDSPTQLDEYFKAMLLADAAQVPYTMTCGETMEDSLLSRLVIDNDKPGQLPKDSTGHVWTPTELCAAGNEGLRMARERIRRTLQAVVPKTTTDDMVIQFDRSVPISTYTELIAEKQFEYGTIESISIVGSGPHLLVKHLGRTFPGIEIRTFDEHGTLLSLYSRLVHAKVAGVCSAPSLCGYAMISGVGGFLNQENCPLWIVKVSNDDASRVELFQVSASRAS